MAKIIDWYEYRAKKKNAKNNFGKDYFKLMNDAAFGKTMEKCKKL